MSRRASLFALSVVVLAGAALPAAPASAGGEVLDRAPRYHHHHHHVRRATLIEERAPVVRYSDPVLAPAPDSGPRIRRSNFHGRFVGGNYAYSSAYQDVLTFTNNRYLETGRVTPLIAPDLVDPDAPDSVYHSGVPYSRSDSVPEHGGGGIYEQSISLAPAPTRGMFYENRTRDGYVFSYDHETENPACWSRQTLVGSEGVQVRSVWTCPGR
jgi:hypothetical protein